MRKIPLRSVGPRRLARHAVIPQHHVGALHREFANGFRPVEAPGRQVHHPHLHPRERASHRLRATLGRVAGPRHADGGARLREPVRDLHVAPGADLPHQVGRHRRARHHPRPQRREIPAREGPVPHQELEHRRHAVADGDPLLSRSSSAPAASNRSCSTRVPPSADRAHHRRDAEDVEERHRRQHAVAVAKLQRLAAQPRRLHQVAVGEQDALGLPHRARGVEQGQGFVSRSRLKPRLGVSLRRRAPTPLRPFATQFLELEEPVVGPEVFRAHRHHVVQVGKLAEHLLVQLEVVGPVPHLGRDDGPRLRVPELVLELVKAQRRIERHHGGAEPGAGQEGDDPLGPVRGGPPPGGLPPGPRAPPATRRVRRPARPPRRSSTAECHAPPAPDPGAPRPGSWNTLARWLEGTVTAPRLGNQLI